MKIKLLKIAPYIAIMGVIAYRVLHKKNNPKTEKIEGLNLKLNF